MTQVIGGIDYSRLKLLDIPFRVVHKGAHRSYYTTTAVKAYNGDILLFARVGLGHIGNDGHILMFRSMDNGRNWLDPVLIASDPVYDCRNCIAVVTSTGRILLIYGKYDAVSKIGHGRWLRFSDTHGYHWSDEISCATIGITTASDYQGSVGTLVLDPTSSNILYAVDGEDADYKVTALYRSSVTQNGLAWSKVTNILDITGQVPNIYEPSLVYLGSRLFCSVRLQEGHRREGASLIGIAHSDDHGVTWSKTRWHPEISPESEPWNCLYPIPGGMLWMTRSFIAHAGQVSVYISRDGLFWFRYRELVRTRQSFITGYISVVPLIDGKSLVIFPVEHGPGGGITADNNISGLYAIQIPFTELDATGKGKCQIIEIPSLAAGATSSLADCYPIDLSRLSTLSITGECTYHSAATAGLRLHLRASPDGDVFDTIDWDTWDIDFSAGATVRKTMNQNAFPLVLKVLVENLDSAQAVTDIKITAVGGRQ